MTPSLRPTTPSLRPKLQNIGHREWTEVRDSWLEWIPSFPAIGDIEQRPTLEDLEGLCKMPLPRDPARLGDVEGLRPTMLWEAVFLFQKCGHTMLAAQRLGLQGMHSWCLFNAYHSAYLGAKGIMMLLGVALPDVGGHHLAIDACPQPIGRPKRGSRSIPVSSFREFIIVPIWQLQQHQMWEVFQRVINMSRATCWDLGLRSEILALSPNKITPPRNHFIYKTHYWPINDLESDSTADLRTLIGEELDPSVPGFLMRLSFSVYRLFEQLLADLAAYSEPIMQQMKRSRFSPSSRLPNFGCYGDFLSQCQPL